MMGNYFAPLPAYNPGGGIDFSPVGNALDGITAQNNTNRQFSLQQRQSDRADQEQQYQHGRNEKQDKIQAVQMFGKQAGAVDQMQGPQRAAAWNSIIARHGADGLTAEELDPVTGPKLMMAQAGQFIDPLDRQAKQLGLQKTQAEINKLNIEAQNGGEAYGKNGAIFLNPETNRYEAVQFGGRGQVKRTELGGLTPSRGVEVVGDTIIDKATGLPKRNIGENLSGGELAKNLGGEGGKYIMGKPREDAAAAVSTIQNMQEARKMLNSGILTGKGANLFVGAKGWADTFGIAGRDTKETLANTQAFAAQMGREVGNVIRAFGSGTGLSDADREYAQAIAGGNIELTSEALRKITDINERLARAKIKTYNDMVSRVQKDLTPFPLEMDAPAPESSDWRNSFKRVD